NNMINSKYTYKYRLYISNDNNGDRDNNSDKDIITNNINNTITNNTTNTHNTTTTNNTTTIINNNDTLKYKWSLLNFIIPKIFNTNKNIYDYINKQMNNINEIIDINASEENILISKIDTLLDIFTFRNNINNNNIIENIIKCGMSSAQKSIYKSIFDKINNNDNNDKDNNINNIMVDLKRICNHPYLFNGIRNRIENNY
ncbi:SNF2 family protein, partial [Spraguea lophii 42_110]